MVTLPPFGRSSTLSDRSSRSALSQGAGPDIAFHEEERVRIPRTVLGASWAAIQPATLVALLASALAFLPAPAAETTHKALQSLRIEPGETRSGDQYAFSERSIVIEGTLDGDLVGLSNSIRIGGSVNGDVIAGARSLIIDGTVGDSIRVCANDLVIDGTIDGDVLAIAQSITIGPKASIRGDLLAVAQSVALGGSVARDVSVVGGQFDLTGSVGGNLRVKGEEVSIGDAARVAGDFVYKAREAIEVPTGTVAGQVQFEPKRADEDEDEGSIGGMIVGYVFWCGAALVVGVLLLAAFRNPGARIADMVGQDVWGSLGVGFVAAVVVPVAAALACILIVTIPLVVLVFFLYFPVLYVAKLPVAVFLGRRLLRLLGSAHPSAGKALLTGVPVLYLIFLIPYLGTLAWWVSLYVGLGAIILGTRAFLRDRSARAPEAPGTLAAPG